MKRFQTKDERDAFWGKLIFTCYMTVLIATCSLFLVAVIMEKIPPGTQDAATATGPALHTATAAAYITVFRGR